MSTSSLMRLGVLLAEGTGVPLVPQCPTDPDIGGPTSSGGANRPTVPALGGTQCQDFGARKVTCTPPFAHRAHPPLGHCDAVVR